ncbi:MAG: prepilin-type N-terminal cleavage/methylation domain-containing protein [Phycisphaerales bacterium]|nr:prepilin-type N-terminal cleavage/methylation domain-containing protein [Planctomycetota bacterium]MCH8508206.1 prepilin-type N-terminal cleavage/methylation domain-containing protein [Phycisphaerales bacterium]
MSMRILRRVRRAFTLVEILIVVVILGILAAIVVPQFVNASEEAAAGTTVTELEKLRRAVDVYMARWSNAFPPVEAGDGTWGPLVGGSGEYLKEAPRNPYIGANGRVIVLGSAPDTAFHTDYGWIYDAATGQIWAGGFNADDEPLPRQ